MRESRTGNLNPSPRPPSWHCGFFSFPSLNLVVWFHPLVSLVPPRRRGSRRLDLGSNYAREIARIGFVVPLLPGYVAWSAGTGAQSRGRYI